MQAISKSGRAIRKTLRVLCQVGYSVAAMEDRSPNMAVVRSVWRRVKKAKIRDLEIRDLEPVKDVKGGGGGVTGKSTPTTGGTGTTSSTGSH